MRFSRPRPLLPLVALVVAPAGTTAFLPPAASLLGRATPVTPAPRPTTRLFEEPGDVRVTDASVFPTIPDDVLVDVYYAEQSIKALGTMGELIEAYHTGLVFEVRDCPASLGVPEKFTVEWYALKFPFGAFLPAVNPLVEGSGDHLGLEWENESYAFYNPAADPNRWSKGTTPIGTVSGATIAQYAAWVVEYCQAHPGYQVYDVWDRPVIDPGKSRRFIEAFTCATFVERSLNAMHACGRREEAAGLQEGGERALQHPKELIKRSYVPMIAGGAPAKVDTSDPAQAQGVRDFYVEMRRAAEGEGDGGSLSSSEFIRFIGDKLDYYYVYDTPDDEYYRIDVVKPYIALTHLYQPMSLPWQRLDLDGDGTLDDPAGFLEGGALEDAGDSFLEDFAGLGSEVGGLLKRQLPKVLEKNVWAKVNLPVAGAAAVLLLVVVSQFDGLSFWSGVSLGAFLGVKGSQILSKDK